MASSTPPRILVTAKRGSKAEEYCDALREAAAGHEEPVDLTERPRRLAGSDENRLGAGLPKRVAILLGFAAALRGNEDARRCRRRHLPRLLREDLDRVVIRVGDEQRTAATVAVVRIRAGARRDRLQLAGIRDAQA